MKKNLFHLLFFTLLIIACQENNADSTSEYNEPEYFGAKVSDGDVNSFVEFASMYENQDSFKTKTIATVTSVCQSKGCWMKVADSDGSEQKIHVQFADYGFFVPKDIAGRKVVIEGTAYKAVTPVSELRHLAEDAGKSKEEIEAITEPKAQLKFMADGVILMPEDESGSSD
jgi:hypothetical protein